VLVVDASALYEVLTNGPLAAQVRTRLSADPDQAAPQLIDAEVVGLLRRDSLLRNVDETTGALALRDLMDWPGERLTHRPFLDRVWELRDNVRTWDAFYVAVAEALDCSLLTLDARLARARGPRCKIDAIR
jgi:predicted nucleic acid-binding protein